MICPNCNHREEYDFFICPKCQYVIETDIEEIDGDFDSELEGIIDMESDDLTYQLDVSELIFEDDLSMRKKNPLIDEEESGIENIVDDLIEGVKEKKKEIFLNSGYAPLIGRDNELLKMYDVYGTVKNNKQVASLTIVGKHGVGKSRLVAKFLEQVNSPDDTIIQVQNKENSKNEDYYIFSSIIKNLANILDKDLKEIKKDKLKTLLKKTTPFHLYHELKQVFLRLLRIKTDPEIEKLDIMSYDRILKRSLRQLFNYYTKSGLFIIAIKDIHYSDTRTMEMIEYFLSLPNYKNILFLLTSEEEETVKKLLKGDLFRRYFLKILPLKIKDSFLMVKEILKEIKNIDKETISLIIQNTDGNPFYIEESIRFLVDSGIIKKRGELFVALNKDKLKKIKLPKSIEGTIEVKLGRIPPFEYVILQLASIAGKTFYKNIVHVLINVDLTIIKAENRTKLWLKKNLSDNIDNAFLYLTEKGIISIVPNSTYAYDSEFKFNQPQERDMIYNTIPIRDRVVYHRYLAQYLESKLDKKMEKNLELISLQYKLSENWYKASKFYFIAAQKAEERYSNLKAIELYEEALKLLPKNNVLNKVDLLHNLGSLYNLIGKTDKAIEAFIDMANLSSIIIFYNKVGAAYNKIGRIYRDQGVYKEAERYLQRAYDYFSMGRDKRGIASTQDDMGRLYWQKGEFDKSLKRYMTSLEIRKKLKNTISIALSLNNIGLLYYSQGFVEEAEEYLFEAYKLRKEVKDRKGEMGSLNNLATLTYNKGDDIQAKSLWQKSLTIAEEIGDVKFQAICMNNLGEVLMENEHFNKSEDYFKNGLEIALETSNKRIIAGLYLNLGELMFRKRQISTSKTFLEQSLEISEEIGEPLIKGRVYCVLGDIEGETLFDGTLKDDDGVQPAEEYYLRSLDILRKISEPLMASTNISYAQYLIGRGKRGKAKKLLLQAEKIYENYNMQLKLSKVKRLRRDIL